MFDNIGGKIKTLAMVLCVIGMIVSLVFAIVLWSQNDEYNYVTRTYSNTIPAGFGVLVGGCIASWIGSFFMYGFGELIEETTMNRVYNEKIYKLLYKQDSEKDTQSSKQDTAGKSKQVQSAETRKKAWVSAEEWAKTKDSNF